MYLAIGVACALPIPTTSTYKAVNSIENVPLVQYMGIIGVTIDTIVSIFVNI
jgi:hypothetical protein